MVFSSPLFLFAFLPVVLLVHFLLKSIPARNAWLLAVSVLFYAWGEPLFAVLLVGSTCVNTWFAWRIQADRKRAYPWLVASVVFNLGIIAYYKYAYFLLSTVAPWTGFDPAWAKVVLPIGISFFTFQAMTYVIDVYRNEAPAQRNPAKVALYIFFFPQLIAGPIVRYQTIAEAIDRRRITRSSFASGIQHFVKGLSKKVLVANVVAVPADKIFALSPADLSPATAWLGVVCYALQIYFDFSGYSDMAIGLGRMFGFEFLKNFDYPYVARSVREFWRRWHISLSTFFRDYVYIPLGGNRGSAARTYFNLAFVFFLCGLWHGASWTFVAWGLFHGVFLVIERTPIGRALDALPWPLRWAYAMAVVLVGWVFFRADTMAAAGTFLRAMAGSSGATPLPAASYLNNEVAAALVAGVLFSGPIFPWLARTVIRQGRLARFSWAAGSVRIGQAAAVLALFVVSIVWLAGHTYNPFIYFRF